jgi:hypothetical protein
MKPENVENMKSISVAADTVFDGFSKPSWRLMHQFCYLKTREPSLTVLIYCQFNFHRCYVSVCRVDMYIGESNMARTLMMCDLLL